MHPHDVRMKKYTARARVRGTLSEQISSAGKASIKLTRAHSGADLDSQESADFLGPVRNQTAEVLESMSRRWMATLQHHLPQTVANFGSGPMALAFLFALFLLLVGLCPSESASTAVYKCLPMKGTASEDISGQLNKSGFALKHDKIKRSSSAYGSLAKAMSSRIKRSLSGNLHGLESTRW